MLYYPVQAHKTVFTWSTSSSRGASQLSNSLLVILVIRQPPIAREHVLFSCRRIFHFHKLQMPSCKKNTHKSTSLRMHRFNSFKQFPIASANHNISKEQLLQMLLYCFS